jgi:hypothetical protein
MSDATKKEQAPPEQVDPREEVGRLRNKLRDNGQLTPAELHILLGHLADAAFPESRTENDAAY